MIAMNDAEFDRAVEEALAAVPAEFKSYMENVVVEVRPRPSRAFCREHDVDDDLLGLYVGVPLEDRHSGDAGVVLPDRIYIFRDNLCEMCESREQLLAEIRVTVLHEVGHFFGLDEERLEELGYD
jgi:predicted Zn-dependent protease with MMP-like domain